MRLWNNPQALRIFGAVLLLTGVLAFLGLRSLFLDHWIVVVMYGLTTWIAVAAYVALAVGLAGAVLLAASLVPRRREVAP
ncbi:MAG: hypothetical protein REJ23_04530 [Brevundimonas sp.]|nr:hypothetical protein [Brevundimonas sp.]